MPKPRSKATEEVWVTEDWTKITQPALRKRIQNRISQRKHRAKKRQQNQLASRVGTPQPPAPASLEANKIPHNPSAGEGCISTAASRQSPGIIIDTGDHFNWSGIQRHETLTLEGNNLLMGVSSEWENWTAMCELDSLQDIPFLFPLGNSPAGAKTTGVNPHASTSVHIRTDEPKHYFGNSHFSSHSEKSSSLTSSNPESSGTSSSQRECMELPIEWDDAQANEFQQYFGEVGSMVSPRSLSGVDPNIFPTTSEAKNSYRASLHGDPLVKCDPEPHTPLSSGRSLSSGLNHWASTTGHPRVETTVGPQLFCHGYGPEDQKVDDAGSAALCSGNSQRSAGEHRDIFTRYNAALVPLGWRNPRQNYATAALADHNPTQNPENVLV